MKRASPQPVLRHVVAQPAPQEHRDRVGRQPLHERVVPRLHAAEEPRGPRSPSRAGRRSRPQPRPSSGDLVDARAGSPGTRRGRGRARRRRRRPRGRRARGAGPSPTRTGRRRSRRRAGRAAPWASRRSWVRTSSAMRYGITIAGLALPSGVEREHLARRPRRRCPTPGASAASARCAGPGRAPSARPRPRAGRPRRPWPAPSPRRSWVRPGIGICSELRLSRRFEAGPWKESP